jgi:uncharacterized membrane protein
MATNRALRRQFVLAFVVASIASTGLFFYGAWLDGSFRYNYLLWNLFLAYLPLIFAIRLLRILERKLWSSWEALLVSSAWLLFLPNSFYMISDFIHVQDVPARNALYDTILLTSFIYTAVVLGFSSLYLVHLRLKQRLSPRTAASMIAAILFVCSFAIYIGRDLRWNSWDVVTNPGGLLFDVSDRLLSLSGYPEMVLITVSFFVLLASMYGLVWRGSQLLQSFGRHDLL